MTPTGCGPKRPWPGPAAPHPSRQVPDRSADTGYSAAVTVAPTHALHTIALCRLRYDASTRAYAARRAQQGLTGAEILRCVKRYIVREVCTALRADFTALTT